MTNNKYQITNEILRSNDKVYDPEGRTAKFGEAIIKLTKKIPQNPITLPLIAQLVKSGTSIGANYNEADGAESKKDFIHKVSICKKESKETKYWLRIIQKAMLELPEIFIEANENQKKAQKFILIFSALIKSSKNNQGDKPNVR